MRLASGCLEVLLTWGSRIVLAQAVNNGTNKRSKGQTLCILLALILFFLSSNNSTQNIFSFFVFHCYRSSVVRADGVSAGGPERGGHVGSGAAELWRAAEGRLPQLPVHRPQPPGHRHAGVLHRGGALRWLYLGPAGTQSSGQSQTRCGWWAEGDWPAGGSRTVWLCQFSHSLMVVINLKQQETGVWD